MTVSIRPGRYVAMVTQRPKTEIIPPAPWVDPRRRGAEPTTAEVLAACFNPEASLEDAQRAEAPNENKARFDAASIEDRDEWACREMWLNDTPEGRAHPHPRHMDFADWMDAGKPKAAPPPKDQGEGT